MSEKKIYIHVGTPKTGTSAIQVFLRENLDQFKKNGYLVYTAQDESVYRNLRFLMAYLDIFGHKELNQKRMLPNNSRRRRKMLNKWFSKFITDIRKSPCRNIILSDEILWRAVCGKTKMQELFDCFKDICQVKIIVYLRRQDHYLMSIYQQNLKAGDGDGRRCLEWIEHPENLECVSYSHYAENLKWLSGLVGEDNIIVRVYEKEQFDGGTIFSDFMTALELDLTNNYKIPEKNINEGMSPFTAEMARCFSKNNIDSLAFMPFAEKYGGSFILNRTGVHYNFLSPDERIKLMDVYEPGNKYIAETFLGRKDGKLFLEPLPNPDPDWSPYELNDQDVLSFLLQVMVKQERELKNLGSAFGSCRRLKDIYREVPLSLKMPIQRILKVWKDIHDKLWSSES